MAKVFVFTFNPFQENTYIVADDNGECVVFDPGCYYAEERKKLSEFIENQNLTPVRLINTHCHIDHVFGNRFVAEKYRLPLEIHAGELPVLQALPQVCLLYGIPLHEDSPAPGRFIEAGEEIRFGSSVLKAIFTPGHSPASLSFFCEKDRFLIAGDVLFYDSIGRTDLPGGDFDTLIRSIKEELFPLGDDVVVHPGHGESTTIGRERQFNPFLTGEMDE
jgi:glyoxylase-like metal-dependent hydrolase (beta-lactamase superfamily II)